MIKLIEIYTDGGYRISKNIGGWAFVAKSDTFELRGSGAVYHTTSNRMEIQGLLESLKALDELSPMFPSYKDNKIKIISDSKYLTNSARSWVYKWAKNNFHNKKNIDQWREYLEISKDLNLSFHWVKGHSGNYYNEKCDELASIAIDKYIKKT